MKYSLLLAALAFAACSRAGQDDSVLAVWNEGESWHGDDLRIYFSPQDPEPVECAGALVRLERHAPPEPSELHLTFLAAPLAEGVSVDAHVVPTSELGHPYVQFPLDPSIFENEGSLVVHVPARPLVEEGVRIEVSESVLRRDPADRR